MLMRIVAVIVCQSMWADVTVTTEFVVRGEVVQQRINPYGKDLQLLLREPPLKHAKSVLHKDLVQELWMEQKLDQFDIANNKTWLMVSLNTSLVTVYFPLIYLIAFLNLLNLK